ncbi:MAG TPA: WD40 repeat domain-containing protein, partial [Polyangia bacterium]|nr:WD40 repeat domain-containing protein [Polyangia bacterium]
GGTGVAGTGGFAGTGGIGGTSGTGGVAGQPSCGDPVGTRPPLVAPPSLALCTEYTSTDPGAVCNKTTNANNPFMSDIAVSPDGQYMATAGSHRTNVGSAVDNANDRVRIWRLVGSTPTQCAAIAPKVAGTGPAYVAFSPDGQYLAIAWRKDYVYVYSVPSFTLVGSILSSYGPLFGVGFSSDSQTVFSIDYDDVAYDGVLYADRLDGTPITTRTLGVDPDVLAVSPVMGMGNVTTLAVGGYLGDAGVYTFNGTTLAGPTLITTATGAATWALQFNPSGNLLAVGTDDGVVRFWNIPLTLTTPTGNPITVTPGSTVVGLSFSPLGSHLAVGFDYEADIFNVTTRAFVSRTTAAVDYVDSVRFSASGGALIAGEDSCGRLLICAD